jgi:hypothetical protein
MLSRRIVHYTKGKMLFECQSSPLTTECGEFDEQENWDKTLPGQLFNQPTWHLGPPAIPGTKPLNLILEGSPSNPAEPLLVELKGVISLNARYQVLICPNNACRKAVAPAALSEHL